MFPFGSVLTHIPLIILAFAYLLYAGAAALNKTKEHNESDVAQSGKVQNVAADEINPGNRTLSWDKALNEKAVAFCEQEEKWDFYDKHKYLHLYIPERKFISCFNGSDIYSRPPPSRG